MKKYALLLVLIAALFLWFPSLAQSSDPPTPEPLVLTDEQGEYLLGRHMDILEDPSGELTIDQVSSPEYASSFTPSEADVPIYGLTTSAFWIRLRLRNETSSTDQWLLEVNFPNLNYVDLYLPAEGGGYWVKQSGALRPFNTRDIPYYHVVFRLPLASQDEDTFYIRVESGSSMTLAFTLWSPEAFAINKISDMMGIGLFYGALLIMLGYHLFALFSLKEANYLYFILFLASSIFFWATYEGVADQFLWPGLSQEKRFFMTITMSFFFMSSLKFGDAFLEQKTRAPRYHQLFNLFIGLWGLMIVVVPFLNYGIMSYLVTIGLILTPLLTILAGIHSFRKGSHPAQFYLVSWLGYLLGIIMMTLVRIGVLTSTPITERFYHIGLIWLVLMSSVALADRINLLKAETENANRSLLDSESRLNQFLEAMPVGVMIYDANQKPHFINERARALLSDPSGAVQLDFSAPHTLGEMMGSISLYRPGSDQPYPREQRPMVRAIGGEMVEEADIEVSLGDRRFPVEAWARPILDGQNRVQYALMAFQDTTRRKQTEAELNEYRHQLEGLVEQRTEELSAANAHLRFEITERQRLEDVLRLRLEWMAVINQVNQTVTHLSDLPQAYLDITGMIKKLFGASEAFLAELDTQGKELKLLSHSNPKDVPPGTLFYLESAALSGLSLAPGKPISLSRDRLGDLDGPAQAHFRDSECQLLVLIPMYDQVEPFGLLGLEFLETEKYFSDAEATLLEKICFDITQVRGKARLTEQAQALIAAEERNRLARDLHDSVTQVLFSANLVADVLPQIWRRDPELALQSLENLRTLTRGALAEMRTLLLELRPSAVIKTPLSDLLAQLTEAVTSRKLLPFQLFIEKTPTLPENVQVSFYRVAQESLNNVIKHAQASLVSVSLSATPLPSDSTNGWSGEVVLMVRDDGCGFNIQESETRHLGLAIMRERAAAIDAELSVVSQPGHGTTVTLIWRN